jgi:hypothetical protein
MPCTQEKKGCRHVFIRKPEGREPLGKPRHRWDDVNKEFLNKSFGTAWTGFIWLWTWTGGEVLLMQRRNCGFHKVWGIP